MTMPESVKGVESEMVEPEPEQGKTGRQGEPDRLIYGRMKGLLKRKAEKRLRGDEAEIIIVSDGTEVSKHYIFPFIEEIRVGKAVVYDKKDGKGKEILKKFGLKAPCVLAKIRDGYRVGMLEYDEKEDTYRIVF